VTCIRSFAVRALAVGLALASSCARAEGTTIAATVTDMKGKPVADAVVVAIPADGASKPAAKSREATIDQIDLEFVPRVLAISVGTPVTFPNHDRVRHHVYSFSPAKRFELPLYSGMPAQAVVFDQPGVVVLGCNIHDWMISYVYVSESPYYAKTGPDGRATINELPPRAYVVRVWHPELEGPEEGTRRNVDTSRSARADVAWQVDLRPEMKVRRAPAAGRGSRY